MSSYLRRTAPSGGSWHPQGKHSAGNCSPEAGELPERVRGMKQNLRGMKLTAGNNLQLIPPPLRSSSYLRRTVPSGGSRHLERKQTGWNSSPKIGEVPEGRRGMKQTGWNCFLLIPPPLRSSSYLRRTVPSGSSCHPEGKQSGRNCSPILMVYAREML